ncbi:DUF4129 domain-containing protein [Dermacoccaceae bacterium W4C1]
MGGSSTSTRRWAAVAALVLLIALVLLAAAGGDRIAGSPTRDIDQHTLAPKPSLTLDRNTASVPPPTTTSHPGAGWLRIAFLVLVIVVVAIGLWLALRRLQEWLRTRSRSRADDEPIPPSRTNLQAAMAHELAGIDDAIAVGGDPTQAAIAAWVALERAVSRLGIERAPAETSAQLVRRVLSDLSVDHEALDSLHEYYREARFSAHRFSATDLEHARTAWQRVRSSLKDGQP